MSDTYDLLDAPDELLKLLSDAGMLDDRMAQATYLRNRGALASEAPMPEGRTPQPGFQAANPMEIWAAVLKGQKGNAQEAEGQQQLADMLRQYKSASYAYLKHLQNKQQQAKDSMIQDAQDSAGWAPEGDPQSHDPAVPKRGPAMIPAPYNPFPMSPVMPAVPKPYNPTKMPWEP